MLLRTFVVALAMAAGIFAAQALSAPIHSMYSESNLIFAQDQKGGGAATNTSPGTKAPAKKPKKPKVVKEPKPHPAGAAEATKGQKGKCICSTNAAGNTTCTGDCSQ
jgi:hypothetical protein